MKRVEITAKVGKDEKGPSVAVGYSMPENFAEAAKVWGEEVLFTKGRQSIVIDLQAIVRRLLGKSKTQAEIQAEVDKWKPGVAGEVVRKTAAERVQEDITKLSPEQLAILLRDVQAKIAAKKQAA